LGPSLRWDDNGATTTTVILNLFQDPV